MPTLRRYADGRGFYLVGRAPDSSGFGYCTWQIRAPGLAYLAGHGVSQRGDLVRVEHLRSLIARKLVWTVGDPPAPPPPPWVVALAACLERWAAEGRIAALARIVYPAGGPRGDRLEQCFPTAFFDWADFHDPTAGLSRHADISASEFESLAANTAAVATPLFAELAERGATGVVWRLTRVVGMVAAQLRGSQVCPVAWEPEPLLSWLFRTLQLRDDPKPPPPGPRGFLDWVAPRIVWQVDLQQVVAVMPAQRVPAGCVGVSWQVVGQGPAVTPRVAVRSGGRAVEESVSGPLRPASGYVLDFTPSGGAAGARWMFDTPTELPALLFHPDGRLADGEDGDPLTPGRYLCLVRAGHDAADGVTLVEPVDVSPVGWGGWSGWVAELSPGAAVQGYRVVADAAVLRWEAESPSDAGVQWLHAEPVYVGRLPKLTLSDMAAFRDAAVRVIVGDATAGEAEFSLPLETSGGGTIDLNAAPQLRARYGRFRLRCQPPGRPDHPPLVMQFTRLPEMHFEYVADPVRPAAVAAVRVAPAAPLPGLTAGPDTELRAKGVSVVLRALTPESAPGVSARDPAGGFEFRVRVGVARGCLLTPRHGLTAWSALPVRGIDLATVGLDDRLRLEFPTPPFTHDGRIVFRLAGREELHAGEPLDRLDPPRVYEVNLHRWRDGFGVPGMVQARLDAGWVNVAELTAAGTAPPPPPPEPPTPWQQLADEVEAALRAGDDPSTLIAACLAGAAGLGVSPFAADLLPVAAARAALASRPPAEWAPVRAALAPLALRPDLPEAKLLAATFDLRQGDDLTFARLEVLRATLPDTPDAAVVKAECWYRHARHRNEFAPGGWVSCRRLCHDFLATPTATGTLAVSDAVLLRELADLMSKQPPGQSVPDLLPGHRAWVEAVRAAGLFMTRPWNGVASGVAELRGPAPSVLCRRDEVLIRVLAGMSAGRADIAVHWRQVQPLGVGFFPAMPLLEARYARATGDATGAREAYDRAWATALATDDRTLELIAAERI